MYASFEKVALPDVTISLVSHRFSLALFGWPLFFVAETSFLTLRPHSLIKVAENSEAVVVHGDNMYMYGEVGGSINENLPYHAMSKKGIVRGKISKMLLDAHTEERINATIGRASCFYGACVDESLVGKNIFQAAITGQAAPVLGNIDVAHTFTYIKDFAKSLVYTRR